MVTDILIVLWGAALMLPTAIAFARGGAFGIGWWAGANLLLGWHPTFWLVMLVMALRWRTAE